MLIWASIFVDLFLKNSNFSKILLSKPKLGFNTDSIHQKKNVQLVFKIISLPLTKWQASKVAWAVLSDQGFLRVKH